jgi:translation initiation factor IF-3
MKYYRLNNKITAPQLRLVNDQGKYLGVFSIEEAFKMAHENELDLIEISPKENPPVVKMMDFGKFLYDQKKKDKDGKKKKQEMKSLRLSPRAGKHDLEVRMKQALKFIGEGHKVKIEMMLRGREMAHQDLARKIMDDFVKSLGQEVKIEQPISRQGNKFNLLISK